MEQRTASATARQSAGSSEDRELMAAYHRARARAAVPDPGAEDMQKADFSSVLPMLRARTGASAPASFDPWELERRKADSYNAISEPPDETGWNCPECKNKGQIYEIRQLEDGSPGHIIRPCKCQATRRTIRRMQQSGLENIIHDNLFPKFEATEPWQQTVKDAAMEYAKNPKGWFYIGGQSGCVDADTEFFNGTGWVRMSDYVEGDSVLQYDPETKTATLTTPKRYIKKSASEMYHVGTLRGSIDMCLSPDHNFAYLTSKGHMQKKPFAEVMRLHKENVQGFYGRVETAFGYDGDGIPLDDNEIRIMCAVIADGSFAEGLSRCAVNVKKERKKQRMRELLKDIPHKEYLIHNGYSRFVFKAPRREKVFSAYWYGCNGKQLEIIADEVFYWDGSTDGKGRQFFFSTEKESADFVQFALSATGSRATISSDCREGQKTCYTVIKSRGNSTVSMVSTGGRAKAVIKKMEPKDGLQYCFEVDTGYLVLRRNGRIFITGNSGKTHLCTAICREELLRGRQVVYMMWRDDAPRLKTAVNREDYPAMVDQYKKAPVLYIDDLFKTGRNGDAKVMPTSADVNLAYEIINFRYVGKLPTIISSEFLLKELVDIDEALTGRIAQMAGGNSFNIKLDRGKNYRLKGMVEL